MYALAVGALQVYVFTDILALFASSSYIFPTHPSVHEDSGDDLDLSGHLTNTCLQSDEDAQKAVFLLSDLVGRSILSSSGERLDTLSQEQVRGVVHRIGQMIGETFRAALGMPNHFTVHTYCTSTNIADTIVLMRRLSTTPSKYSVSMSSCPPMNWVRKRLRFPSIFSRSMLAQISSRRELYCIT